MFSSKVVRKWQYKKLECVLIENTAITYKTSNVAITYTYYCGYVGIPKAHPLWGKEDYSDICHLDVHGGITFSEKGDGSERWSNTNLWYFGFDCAHAGDAPHGNHKWTLAEIIKETECLADQLAPQIPDEDRVTSVLDTL